MARKKKTDTKDVPAARLLEMIDEEVVKRGEAVLAVEDTTAEISRLASEARRKGAEMKTVVEHIKRMDRKTRKLVPVTRQNVDTMLAVHEQRREPRTTRASRRRRDGGGDSAPAGGTLNVEALA
jgi:hypothetical protein